MSHTPGPWKLDTVPTTIGICHKIGEFPNRNGRIRYACVYDDGGHMQAQDGELLANARLMAASPDLLEALKACRRQLYEWDTEDSAATSLANVAIAKAEGAAVEVDEPIRLVRP